MMLVDICNEETGEAFQTEISDELAAELPEDMEAFMENAVNALANLSDEALQKMREAYEALGTRH